MAGKSSAIPDRFYGRIDRAAGVVPEYQDERSVEHLHGIFEACENFIAGEIARDPADENVAARRVKAIFRRDARVAQLRMPAKGFCPVRKGSRSWLKSCRLLTPSTYRALPFIKRSSAASGDRTFSGFGGALAIWASACERDPSPAAAVAPSFRTVRRSTIARMAAA